MPDPQTVFDAIETRVLSLLPPTVATDDIHWDNVSKAMPDNTRPFARVHFVENQSDLATLGIPGTRRSEQGTTFFLGLFVPKNDGDGLRSIRAARFAIEKDLRSNPIAGVIFQTFLKADPGLDGDFYQINLSALMQFDAIGH